MIVLADSLFINFVDSVLSEHVTVVDNSPKFPVTVSDPSTLDFMNSSAVPERRVRQVILSPTVDDSASRKFTTTGIATRGYLERHESAAASRRDSKFGTEGGFGARGALITRGVFS